MMEVTFNVPEGPVGDRIAEDMARYSLMMETVAAYGQQGWSGAPN